MRILSSLSGLNDKIEHHNHPSEPDTDLPKDKQHGGDGSIGERGKTGIKVIDGLERKIEVFESGEKSLQREMDAIHRELGEMSLKIQKAAVGALATFSIIARACR